VTPGSNGSSPAALIEARLGRPPQDMLEAAVVLEAWGGVPAQRALDLGSGLMRGERALPQPSIADVPPLERRPELLLEGLAFVVSVLSIALWAAPLADALGADAFTRALTLALPLTLALQWGLRSRYLSRPHGLAELARARAGLGLAAVAVLALPALALGRAGAVAGLLTLTWAGGAILMRRGWAAAYAAIVLGATPAMVGGVPPLAVLTATAAVTAAAVAAALRTPPGTERRASGSWARALACAALGAALGTMLVADPSIGLTTSATPALALLPSAIAGVWGGHRLWHLAHAFPRALAGLPAIVALAPDDHSTRPETGRGDPSPDHRSTRPEHRTIAPRRRALLTPLGVFGGAILRLAGAAAAGSVALAAVVPVETGLLAAFALLSLATLLMSLLEAMGRTGWAALGVACALAAELIAGTPFPGAGLAAGGAVAVLVLLPAAVAPLLRPAQTLGTTLWIA
jgi:hypothetical protein